MKNTIKYSDALSIPKASAICYSGFRKGQSPGDKYPSYAQVKEDLILVEKHWKYIRLYSCDAHSKTVLEVIKNENFPLKVMLGAYIIAEENNKNCPWGGGVYTAAKLKKNKEKNKAEIKRLIAFANAFPDIIFSLSVGNEACVDWTDHMVPVSSVIDYVKEVKINAKQPVTFCENYVPWLNKLTPLVNEVDFISIHTYPVWEYKTIEEALEYTKKNFNDVAKKYPKKLIVITEAGWTTKSNGIGIPKDNVGQIYQKIYYQELSRWCNENEILTFFFEAFDEPWKGSEDPNEPEKHWGLFFENRSPKRALSELTYKAVE